MAGAVQPQGAMNASMMQQIMTDNQQAQTIYMQIAADAQKQRVERQKIQADLQTKTFEIMQDVTVNKQKTADKAFNACDAYIRG